MTSSTWATRQRRGNKRRAEKKRRPLPSGRGPQRNRLALFEQLETRVLLDAAGPETARPFWQPQGPAPIHGGLVEGMEAQSNPVVGAINVVVADPTDAGTVYVGTAGGGVWKTTNAGAADPNWIALTDSVSSGPEPSAPLAGLAISTLVFDATDPSGQTIVAGIGRQTAALRTMHFNRLWDGAQLTGLIRTENAGEAWEIIDGSSGALTLSGHDISGLAVDGQSIVVSWWDFEAFEWQLLTSADGGTTFQQAVHPTAASFGPISDIVLNPVNSSIVYAAEIPVGASKGGVYEGQRNANGSWSWTQLFTLVDELGDIEIRYADLAINDAGTALRVATLADAENTRVVTVNLGDATRRVGPPVETTEPRPDGDIYVGLHPDRETLSHTIEAQSNLSLVAGPFDPVSGAGSVLVGGQRQPGNVGEPPDDTFSVNGRNSIGAEDFSARLFRLDTHVGTIGGGTVVAQTATPLTHVTAPETAAVRPIANVEFGAPVRILSPGHGLVSGDQVYVFGVESTRSADEEFGFGVPAQLWTVEIAPGDNDWFSLAGSDIPEETYLRGGAWFRYDGGSAPHSGSRHMTLDRPLDQAGDLLEADDGGLYRRTNPFGDLGVWTSLNGNLQITEFHTVDWDHNFGLISGAAFDVGVARQNSPGSSTWTQLATGQGSTLLVDDSQPGETLVYSSQPGLGNFQRRHITNPDDPGGGLVEDVRLEMAGYPALDIYRFDGTLDDYSYPAVALSEGNSNRDGQPGPE